MADDKKDLQLRSKQRTPNPPRKVRFSLWFLLLAVWVIILAQSVFRQVSGVEELTYSVFLAKVDEGQVESVVVSGDLIQGQLKAVEGAQPQRFRTIRVEDELADRLRDQGVHVAGTIENTFLRDLASWVVPAVIFVGIWLYVLRRMGSRGGGVGGMMSIGKSKAKVYVEENLKITFQDVAGVDEAEEELEEIVSFLRDPTRYSAIGGRMPKGILLVGPPGTGKTLLARAVAGEAKVTFFYINGSEFVELFVGVGAARVRDLFEQARQHAPCIVFIDELDALGRARAIGGYSGAGNDEKEQTLNQLLVELDGFDASRGVVLMAATNRPEVLDPALLRAGRFDRQILVDRPDLRGRVAIIKIHARNVKLADQADLEAMAAMTPGFTGADLANLVNEAALLATRKGHPAVQMDDLTEALERIVAGLAKHNRLINPRERQVVAHHEMGHALVSLATQGLETVHKVSIIPRGIGALGYTMQRPTEDRFLMGRSELEAKMAIMLAGRAAEAIIFGEISTGASDDLQKATNVARGMIMRYGMGTKIGMVVYEPERASFLGGPEFSGPRDYSEETAREIDCEVRALITRAFEQASEILTREREGLVEGARRLLEKETLSGEELAELLRERGFRVRTNVPEGEAGEGLPLPLPGAEVGSP